ncbi:iron ABC transporter permease [Paenibacillus sp. CF384]|uniref:FecCD family ABC transporter permease n=1 Tax=Paenibacillus sp. CF384 TaxID=1884382 RepID=UPI00089AE7F6|nr:iron ABC transporter permease [Paenibacillus sp. CF384]SDX07627.1 iron complex transport system permease protein [Paenibacillus sp. CF384]
MMVSGKLSTANRLPVKLHRPTMMTTVGLASVLIAVAAAYLMVGESMYGPLTAWRALWGTGEEESIMIVQSLRAPRLAIAILAGASLALSGAILQAIIRNPLAAPDVVGITGGASFGAVVFITALSGSLSIRLLPVAAIIGAFCAAALVYAFAWKRGASSLRLVLVGIGVSSLLSAGVSFMLAFSQAYAATSAYIWLMGTIYGSSWEHVWTLLPWTIALGAAVYFHTRVIQVQLLGDEIATGIGSAVQRHRLLLVFLSVGLAGSAVSIGGAIGFVGLIAPHAARRLVGPVMGRVLPVSALFGAIVVAAADLIGRTLFLPLDIPVGVFTSAIGAPFFIFLLYRSRNRI